jgi:hypothetical protein
MDLVGLVSKATKVFLDVNTISVDNWTFKLYYKASLILVIICSVLVTSRQMFGAPIVCDAGAVSSILSEFTVFLYFENVFSLFFDVANSSCCFIYCCSQCGRIHGLLGTWVIGQLGSWALGHLGSFALGDLGNWVIGLLGTWALGQLGSWALGHLDSGALGLLGTWAIGLLGTWALGHLGSWALGLLGTWALGHLRLLDTWEGAYAHVCVVVTILI